MRKNPQRKGEKVDIHFQCYPWEKKEMKMFFAAMGETMTEGFMKSMRERRERIREEKPNALTRKTLQQSKEDIDVKEYENLDDMFDNWGI